MPTPGLSSSDPDGPYALRPLSRRALLKGLAGVGGLSVATRLLGPGPAYASTTGYVGPAKLNTDVASPVALSLPVVADGRVLHGVWLPNGPASSNSGTVPNYATYVGSGVGGSGRGPAIINYFRAWSLDLALYNTGSAQNTFAASTGAQKKLDLIWATGAIPMLTWEPWDPASGADNTKYLLESLTSGTMDGMIKNFARGCANWGKPLILRLAHEMNTPTYPWGLNLNSSHPDGSAYPDFWRHVWQIFRDAGASNVVWAWIPNIDYNGTTSIDSDKQYPGHGFVDWVGLDGYNGYHSYTYDINTKVDTWSDYPALLDLSIDKLVRVTQSTKPIMIAETGCPDTTVKYSYRLNDGTYKSDFPIETNAITSTNTSKTTHSKSQWFQELYDYAADDSRLDPNVFVKRSAPQRNVRAVCYFDETDENKTSTVPGKASNWNLYGTTTNIAYQCQVGYQAAMSKAVMGHGWGNGTADTTTTMLSALIQDFKGLASGTKVNTLTDWAGSSDLATVKTTTTGTTTEQYASLLCSPSAVPSVYTVVTPKAADAKRRLNGSTYGMYFQVRAVPPTGTSTFRLLDGTGEVNFTCKPTGLNGVLQMTCNYRLNSSSGIDTPVANSGPVNITDSSGALLSDFRWWRIREAAGFIYWETCPDATATGAVWTKQASAYNLLRSSTFQPQFKTGGAAANTSDAFEITNINTGRNMWAAFTP